MSGLSRLSEIEFEPDVEAFVFFLAFPPTTGHDLQIEAKLPSCLYVCGTEVSFLLKQLPSEALWAAGRCCICSVIAA